MNDFVSDNIITIIAVVFVFEVLTGMLAQRIAEKKGRSKRWFWAGFVLSAAGVVWAAWLPDETAERRTDGDAGKSDRPAGSMVPTAQPQEEERSRDGGELAAVLSAAVAAAGEAEGRKFVMRSFRPAGESSTAWNRAGRGRPPPARG